MQPSYTDRCQQAAALLRSAKNVLIGAGAGLSAAGGLTYAGQRYIEHFADMHSAYGLTDMYQSMFFRFPSDEARWGYVSRHIWVNRYAPSTLGPYKALAGLVHQVPQHFVLTTNADGQFGKAGFKASNTFATQGDYALFQCAEPCHDGLYANEAMVREMVSKQQAGRIPQHLSPRCPRCGGPLMPHLRVDGRFVENKQWHEAQARYSAFLRDALSQGPTVLLELGVGFNTPGIIRYPFERLAADHPDVTLLRFNRDHPEVQQGNSIAHRRTFRGTPTSKTVAESEAVARPMANASGLAMRSGSPNVGFGFAEDVETTLANISARMQDG